MPHKPLKIIYAGTPDFAVPALEKLVASEHHVVAVYTQPDRPAGRGRKLTPSSVKTTALKHGIDVQQPISLKEPESQQQLASYHADIMIVAAYGLILPATVLNLFSLGCINIHFSILPRWRGAAPIQRALLAGDKEIGVTIMQMAEGLDTGDMWKVIKLAITNTDTQQDLYDRLAQLGASTLLETLPLIAKNQVIPEKQNNDLATYAHKVTKQEAKIDWQQSAESIERMTRAFYAWPVTHTTLNDQTVRIWQAMVISESTDAKPGSIICCSKAGIDVATGDGILRLLQIQLPGGKALAVRDILNAKPDLFIINSIFH